MTSLRDCTAASATVPALTLGIRSLTRAMCQSWGSCCADVLMYGSHAGPNRRLAISGNGPGSASNAAVQQESHMTERDQRLDVSSFPRSRGTSRGISVLQFASRRRL